LPLPITHSSFHKAISFPSLLNLLIPLSLSLEGKLEEDNRKTQSSKLPQNISIASIPILFMEFSSSRRPCFIDEDDGLASLADMEAGSSVNHRPFFSRSLCYARRGSFRNLSSPVSSPRSARYCDSRYEDHQPHFLEACFLCKKPLGDNRDIFMYRLDISPFFSCSYCWYSFIFSLPIWLESEFFINQMKLTRSICQLPCKNSFLYWGPRIFETLY
jgi:hypothetical protein